MSAIRTLCGGCAMACGVRAVADGERRVRVEGDRIHPVNGGWLCPRGKAMADAGGLEGRLLHARIAGRRANRERAIGLAARRLGEIVERHGPASVAMLVAGDLPTEDYYAANKLMKGFIGSAHIVVPWRDTGRRVHLAAFGEDVMPASLEDVDRAGLILLVGAEGVRRHPALARRIESARRERGARVVVLDDAAEDEAEGGDWPEWTRLALRPGSAALLLGGLLLHGHEAGWLDAPFLAVHVAMPAGFWDDLRPGHDHWSVAQGTGLSIAEIRQFHDLASGCGQMVTLYDPDRGEGREAAAVLNLHLATGRIGRSGAGPFALPGAPNAMGAREVGCLPSTLAAHRDFSDAARASVTRFWSAPRLAPEPGLSGEALRAAISDGSVRALWMLGSPPPDLAWGGERPFTLFAGDRLPAGMADRIDIALPMASELERDGARTGVDRLIGRQRPVFPLPGDARPGWWIVTRIARAMGWHDAFHYERPADIYREHARLSVYQEEGGRLFDLRRHAPLSNPAYDELTPWRWGGLPFADGRFPTADGRARLIPFQAAAIP